MSNLAATLMMINRNRICTCIWADTADQGP